MKSLVLVALCIFGAANAQVRWVPSRDGNRPNDAIQGGNIERQTVFVCRVPLQGDINPGYLDPTIGTCFFGFHGRALQNRIYDAAAGRGNWRAYTRGNLIPNNAALAGFTSNRDQVFVCRARHLTGTVPGKLVFGMCKIASHNIEHEYVDSDILVNP